MKKALISLSIILLVVAIGAGAFAVSEYAVNKRFGFYAKAADGVVDALQKSYLAEISFNNLNLTDGSVVRALQVYVDKEKLTKDVTGLEKEIRLISIDVILGGIESEYSAKGYTASYEEGFLDITLESYDSLTDLYLANDRNGYEKAQNDTDLKWGFWYNKYVYTDTTVFAAIEGTIIESIASDVAGIQGIQPEDISFVYNYGTTYSRHTIDSDADNIYYYNKLGVNIHKFVMDQNNLNREYTINQYAPNVITWYLIAIVIVAIPSAAFIVYAYKKKKEADSGKE